jgi:arsenate reductase
MTTHVLILCTHNSARSVLAEGMLNHWAGKLGKRRAGAQRRQRAERAHQPVRDRGAATAPASTPRLPQQELGRIQPAGAPPLSIVITVCDSAAAEACPVFFGGAGGQPVKVHWGYPDPSNAEGGDEGKRRAFELTRQAIGYRMLQLLALPLETMDRGPARWHWSRSAGAEARMHATTFQRAPPRRRR